MDARADDEIWFASYIYDPESVCDKPPRWAVVPPHKFKVLKLFF